MLHFDPHEHEHLDRSGLRSRVLERLSPPVDHLLIFSRRHLQQVLAEFVTHYNRVRPHRGQELRTPEPRSTLSRTKSLLLSEGEDLRICRPLHPHIAKVDGVVTCLAQGLGERGSEVRIDEEPHANP